LNIIIYGQIAQKETVKQRETIQKSGPIFLIFVIILCKKGVKKADFGQKFQKSGHHFSKNIGLFFAILEGFWKG
jgi:hypothetical protein